MPERFLDENGRFSPKLDKAMPFGSGKRLFDCLQYLKQSKAFSKVNFDYFRLCAGETFARNSLFLVTAALIQQFNLELPENQRMPDPSESHTGILRSAPQFWLKFVPR